MGGREGACQCRERKRILYEADAEGGIKGGWGVRERVGRGSFDRVY